MLKKRYVAGFVALLLVVVGGWVIAIHHQRIWECLIEMFIAFQSIETARVYIGQFGVWGPIVSAILMIFQSILFPLPAFLITFANGSLYGVWWGALLSWSSAMVAAGICFYITRFLGIQRVAYFIHGSAMERADDFFDKYGSHAILIARLIPFLSFDIVSYLAGATRIPFHKFWIATGIGQLPATLVYSYFGEAISPHAKWVLLGFSIIVAVTIIRWILKSRKREAAEM